MSRSSKIFWFLLLSYLILTYTITHNLKEWIHFYTEFRDTACPIIAWIMIQTHCSDTDPFCLLLQGKFYISLKLAIVRASFWFWHIDFLYLYFYLLMLHYIFVKFLLIRSSEWKLLAVYNLYHIGSKYTVVRKKKKKPYKHWTTHIKFICDTTASYIFQRHQNSHL